MGKILAIVIGVALTAFIIGEVARSGSSFMRDSRNEIGEVSGEKVPYDQFSKKVDQNTKNFLSQSGQSPTPQITGYIQETTWNQFISEIILKKEIEKLGLVVSTDETRSMISGNNPNQQIIQAFGDPKTGQIDKQRLNMFLTNVGAAKEDDPMKVQWKEFVSQMIESKKAEKYLALVRTGLYINSLDAKDDYEAKNKLVNFKYAQLDYASLPDAKVTLTDDDYSSYYNEHKAQFKNTQELRSFEYVAFNAAPSKEDTAAVKTEIDKLAADFKTATNDSLFVQLNADTKAPIVFQHKGQLEPKLDSVMFSAAKGTVYGPYFSNGSYKVAKLIDSRVGPDSVKASHILLNPATEGGVDKAKAKADSIKKLLAGGKSFADLAKQFSTDKGSADKGGDLGTFGRGAMVKEFDDAAFEGKKGDIKIVTTQFGVHILRIEDQKGSSKVVKVAIVDKPLEASNKTQSAAYAKAQAFLASLNKDNFTIESQKQGLAIKKADDVNGIASALPGLDNAREIVRWAFKADKGDFTDQVFTVGNQYVIPRLTEIKPEGTLSLDAVKKQIEPEVRQIAKGKQLAAKFEAAMSGASSIDAVAQKAGTPVVPVQNIVFANPVIPGLAAEYKVVGTVFGLPLHKLSKPVQGSHGVYVVQSDNFVTSGTFDKAAQQKQQMQLSQMMLQRTDGQVFDALKDKANVKDYRAKFL
ncbi:peptidylprolyl isomerase [Mucilaginibacter mali]|nr:peptidylprolyl isomerase [Mucilaginibacter mali]